MKYIYLFAFAVALAGCRESEVEFGKADQRLTLEVSSEEVELDMRNPDAEAIAFKWTPANNQGTNAAIEYTLRIDRKRNDFLEVYELEMGRGVYSLAYSNEQFNELLLNTFGANADEHETMMAQVVARVSDDRVPDQVSETVYFDVTTYMPVYKELYMIGDATPGGWERSLMTQMAGITGMPGGFTWTGKLEKGDLKFMPVKTTTSWIPSYNKDAGTYDGWGLFLRSSTSQPDTKFDIDKEGYYRVVANIVDLYITVTEVAGPQYDMLYLEGDFGTRVPLNQDPDNLFYFRYGDMFYWQGGGTIWFSTDTTDELRPVEDNAPISLQAATFSGGSNKWVMTEAEAGKPYKILVDISSGGEKMIMTEYVPYEQLWMVGDAVPSGWDIDTGTALTMYDDCTFSWEGNMTVGEMKITCDRKSNWFGAWFMPAVDGQVPDGTEMRMTLVDKEADPTLQGIDRKWKITTAGRYRVTGNQVTETIVIEPVQ